MKKHTQTFTKHCEKDNTEKDITHTNTHSEGVPTLL